MSTVLVTGATGFVGSHMIPALLAADHRVVALVRTPTDGELVLSRLAPARRAAVETRVGDVTRPDTLGPALAGVDAVVHLVAIPRDFHGGADLRLVNTEGTRAVVAAMTAAGVRRLIHMGAMGVEDVPDLHYASSKAKAEALVRASGLDWTILKPSLQFGTGDGFFNIIAGLVRLSPGIVPVPGDGKARFQPIHMDDVAAVAVRALADPTTIGGAYDLGGPRYWTYREITREVMTALGKRRADRADAGRPHPAGGRDGGAGPHRLPGRDRPAPPAAARQHRAARPDPDDVRLRAASDGGRPRLPADPAARPGATDRMTRTLGRIAGGLIWLAIIVAIALGAAGIVTGMDHAPGTSARPDVTAAGDAEVTPMLDAAQADLSALAGQVEALGSQARGALAALNRLDPAGSDAAIAEGDRLVADVIARTAALRDGPGVRALCRHADRPP